MLVHAQLIFHGLVHLHSWYMGSAALQTSGITAKMLFLLRDPILADTNDPLHKVRKSRIALFVIIQLLGFGAAMGVTQTIGMCLASSHLSYRNLPVMNSGHWIPCYHYSLDPPPDVCHSTTSIYV
jgi:hypothetical protein